MKNQSILEVSYDEVQREDNLHGISLAESLPGVTVWKFRTRFYHRYQSHVTCTPRLRPLPRPSRLDPQAEKDMVAMQTVINLGRFAREKRSISLKTPVKGVTVVCKDRDTLQAVEKLQAYVKGELNAWEVR